MIVLLVFIQFYVTAVVLYSNLECGLRRFKTRLNHNFENLWSLIEFVSDKKGIYLLCYEIFIYKIC